MENNYFLMHKNIQVALLSIDDQGYAKLVEKISGNEKHFPVGGQLNSIRFSDWWKNRSIPDNRDGLKRTLEKMNYQTTGQALIDNLALSLTDCYWIKPRGSSLTWEQVSLFLNDFDDQIGESFFNPNRKIKPRKSKYDIGSSSGELKKKWVISPDGKRELIKGNLGNSFQQSLNEVFISKIHAKLNQKFYLPYEIQRMESDGKEILCCISPNFCNEHVEFVSALEIIESKKKKGSYSLFLLFKQGCLELGMSEKDFHEYMDYLILTDFLFTNRDRHLRNIGILRDPDTLELIGFSPIFDNGNSMFYDQSYADLELFDLHHVKVNSFYPTETKMLNCVRNFHIIDLDQIAPDFSIYQSDTKENQIRYPLIEKLFYRKLEMIRRLQNKHHLI